MVTGASKGIGAAIAEHLAAAGAAVVVIYSSSKTGTDGVVKKIVDVSRQADVVRLFAETKAAYGKLDILVNNAGIYEFAPIDAVTLELFHKQIDKQFDLNVLGLLLTTQEAIKLIGPEGGSIGNIRSVVGQMPAATGSVYSATKAAVDAITVSLAMELGPRKIRVNSLNPGIVETEGLHSVGFAVGDFRNMMESKTSLGRIAQPTDIAAAFFASSDAGWVTGQTLLLAGGVRQ